MNNKALEELMAIAGIEGISVNMGSIAREEALRLWIKTYIVEIETSQPIIKKALTSEDEDFVKYYMAYKMGDELMDECIQVENTKNKITTRIVALRR